MNAKKYLLTIREKTLETYKDLSDKEYILLMESMAVNYAEGLIHEGINLHIEVSYDYYIDFISDPATYETVKKAQESLETYFKEYITVNIIEQPF
jgi:hypothetical protein